MKKFGICIILLAGLVFAGCSGSTGTTIVLPGGGTDSAINDLLLLVSDWYGVGPRKVDERDEVFLSSLEIIAISSDVIIHEMVVTTSEDLSGMKLEASDGNLSCKVVETGSSFRLIADNGGYLLRIDEHAQRKWLYLYGDTTGMDGKTFTVRISEMVISSEANPAIRSVDVLDSEFEVTVAAMPDLSIEAVDPTLRNYGPAGWGSADVLAEIKLTENSGKHVLEIEALEMNVSDNTVKLWIVDDQGNTLAIKESQNTPGSSYHYITLTNVFEIQPGASRTLQIIGDTWNSTVQDKFELWINGVSSKSDNGQWGYHYGPTDAQGTVTFTTVYQ